MFWLMAREYMNAHNIKKELPSLEEFVGEQLVLEEPKKKKAVKERKEKELKSAEEAIEEKMKALAEKADEESKVGKSEESVQVAEAVEQGV
jgi:hypothetical protein